MAKVPKAGDRVKIVGGEHPHRGEHGRLTAERIQTPGGKEMVRVDLEACPHGIAGCFVSEHDIKIAKD